MYSTQAIEYRVVTTKNKRGTPTIFILHFIKSPPTLIKAIVWFTLSFEKAAMITVKKETVNSRIESQRYSEDFKKVESAEV